MDGTEALAEIDLGSGLNDVELAGVGLEKILLALAVLALSVLLRHVLSRWLCAWMAKWAQASANTIDDRVVAAVRAPMAFLPLAAGVFVAAEILALEGVAAEIAGALSRTLLAVTVFWGAARLVEPLAFAMKTTATLSPSVAAWLLRGARIAVYAVGAATVLELWGVRVVPIIAGFGLFGVAVALGAQDMFRNMISGALILSERRFRVGDWVKIDGVVEGTVEAIGLRSTKVRRFDKAPVYIPNARFADDAVTNFGEMTHRRIFWRIGLEYGSTAAQLTAVRDKVEAWIRADERFLTPPEASLFVRWDGFEASSIDLMIYSFTRTRDWGEWLEIKEELLLAVKRIVEEEGAAFAFPSRSLYLADAASEALAAAAGGEAAVKPPARVA